MELALTALTPRLKSQFSSSKNLVDKIKAGEEFDVAFLTTATIADLVKAERSPAIRGPILAEPESVPVSALALRDPTSAPPEAMKQMLLKAKIYYFQFNGSDNCGNYEDVRGT